MPVGHRHCGKSLNFPHMPRYEETKCKEKGHYVMDNGSRWFSSSLRAILYIMDFCLVFSYMQDSTSYVFVKLLLPILTSLQGANMTDCIEQSESYLNLVAWDLISETYTSPCSPAGQNGEVTKQNQRAYSLLSSACHFFKTAHVHERSKDFQISYGLATGRSLAHRFLRLGVVNVAFI